MRPAGRFRIRMEHENGSVCLSWNVRRDRLARAARVPRDLRRERHPLQRRDDDHHGPRRTARRDSRSAGGSSGSPAATPKDMALMKQRWAAGWNDNLDLRVPYLWSFQGRKA